ncbi:hypothetical protein SAY87_018496 [Trapa incisa]|uniref:AP2/ERF domain-containing protein n=1 Tax=Trapa incisa TaxID=236973 RepID=A0AAN7QSU9_9MYRT|nr:hypothetical protein SAY87_018496 [Trapa incisa]
MLDLNVEFPSSDSYSRGHEKLLVMAMEEEGVDRSMLIGVAAAGGKSGEEDGGEENSGGTSDKSQEVAGDENSSCTDAFVFDVFKKDASPPSSRPDFVTRQLFPIRSGAKSEPGHGPLTAATAMRSQWLNLSFGRVGGGDTTGGPLMVDELSKLRQPKQQVRKRRRGPRSRSSQYRGVTFYGRTGRDCRKQVYLGGFDTAYTAARAYDRAAIKFRGVDADINFSISDYEEDMKQIGNLTKEEFVHTLRRQRNSFSKGNRALSLQKCGRWDPRMGGQFLHNKVQQPMVMQFNGQEALAGFDNSNYEANADLGAAREGCGSRDLDLNLGMAPPSRDQRRIKVAGHYGFDGPDGGAPMLVNSSNVSVWLAMYPYLLSRPDQGKAMEKRRVEVRACSKMGWEIPISLNYLGKSASPLMPFLFSSNAAASSGFSCSSSNSSSLSNSPPAHLRQGDLTTPQNLIPHLLMKHSPINMNPFPAFSL